MNFQCFFVFLCIYSSYADQFYDATNCSTDGNYPGTRYSCNNSLTLCHTFLVYRASQHFQTISNISSLFEINPKELLTLNKISSHSEILKEDREVLVPINCSCSGQFSQSYFTYMVSRNTTFSDIACTYFEGLVKSITLFEENQLKKNTNQVGSMLRVPLKCACPDNFPSGLTVRYLVTYPFVEGDNTIKVSQKFGISPEELWEVNNLEPNPTVYPNTTVLVPLKGEPSINLSIPDSDPPTPGFLPTVPVGKIAKSTQLKTLYIAGSVVGSTLVLVSLLVCGLYVKTFKTWKAECMQSSARRSSTTPCSTPRSSQRSGRTTRSSTNSCLSPDLLAGIKYSLCNYSIEEIKRATNDFGEQRKISSYVYKGMFEKVEVVIKQMRFEDTRQVIDVHAKINHVRIVKLLGVCYGENDFSSSYLVFDYPTNGCLRVCLSNSLNPLPWHRRTQIAFDVATGLHYLHYCMVPPYTHMSINSRNIFVTPNWRAKLAVFRTSPAGGSSTENISLGSIGGWIAPEYLVDGLASEKVDIFAFGVVLLELISGIEDTEGKLFKECIGFLGGPSEGGCFEQLRNFLDPCLKENYPLAEALCLAVLAKACVEYDPMHRPTMDDIIKVLARMI